MNALLPSRYLLLALGEENAKLYYFNASALTCLKSSEADIHAAAMEAYPPPAGGQVRDDRQEALQYIFYHKVDHELSLLLKEYPVPVFVTGKRTMLSRFARWTKNVKNIVSYLRCDPENRFADKRAGLAAGLGDAADYPLPGAVFGDNFEKKIIDHGIQKKKKGA
jgi:hypothetical protein